MAESMAETSVRNRPWKNVILSFHGILATIAVLAVHAVTRSHAGSTVVDSIQRHIQAAKSGAAAILSTPKTNIEESARTNEGPFYLDKVTADKTRHNHQVTLGNQGESRRSPQSIRKYASLPMGSGSNHPSEETASRSKQPHGIGDYDEKTVLNIHVVPHTHDDVGWLKTVDQYYNGWNDTIQVVNVREILTSVVEALEENPSRTFTYVETKFFYMWWMEQTESVRQRVQKLVRDTKQLSFANGGWCMHDEASTHFIGMIDQTTLGHDFLRDTFGYVPTVGWQLDPFGHSSTQASLMTYKMGFDALYFGRIDYQDLELRHATKECEGLWNAFGSSNGSGNGTNTDSAIDKGSVFWGLTGSYEGNYGAPGGYCLDVNCGRGQKSFIDKNQTALIAMIKDFLLAVRQQSDRTKGDHVMLTMGSDFQYQRASVNFANLDLLIGTITNLQEDGRMGIPQIFGPRYDAVNIFYSSPEYYTACKYNETLRHRIQTTNANHSETHYSLRHHLRKPSAGIDSTADERRSTASSSTSASPAVEWSIKRDDFFPYSDCPNCFWTGYFTSRPSLKRFERVASSFLLAAKQIESTLSPDSNGGAKQSTMKTAERTIRESKSSCDEDDPMGLLDDAVGVLQHHDGVSGTSKQHVAYDYAKSVQAGIDASVPCTIDKLKRLLLGEDASQTYLKDLTYCQLLNETKCGISVDATAKNHNGESSSDKDLYVIVYNGLASNQSTIIDLPIGSTGKYLVEDLQEASAETIDAVRMPLRFSHQRAGEESLVLSFMAESLPAVGAKVFRIQKHDDAVAEVLNETRIGGSSSNPTRHTSEERDDDIVEISNGHFSVAVDTKTGDIHRIGTQEVESLSSWGYYTSFDSKKDSIHEDDDHNSGAYLFRPSTPNQELQIVPTKNATIVRTSIGTDIHTEYEEPWVQTTTKIREGIPYIEIEYQIGPVPLNDGYGKEVVARYNTGVNNDATFYTDSNAREFIKRRRNERPTWDLTVFEPVAGNYYPVNVAIYVDEKEAAVDGTDLEKAGPAFAVVTDRNQGGASILDGTIELMVHRRTVADDHRGVGEPINETLSITPCPPYGNATRIGEGLVIRGKHRILVENTECQNEPDCGAVGGAQLARSVMDSSFAEPLVFVGSSPSSQEIPFLTKSYSGLKEPLPKNVMLVTKRLLRKEEATSYLIRLAHQYGESVDVDLSILFPHQSIEDIRETTLSGNRDIDDWRKERFDWIPSQTEKSAENDSFKLKLEQTITLASMDIRTLIVKVKSA